MPSQDNFERVQIASQSELWTWLEDHHDQQQSVWLVTFKAALREKYVSREEVLDALIAYGWIDGRRMKLDQDRTMQLIAPRQQQIWAETYKNRAAKLVNEGRMKAPGRAAIERSKAAGQWNELDYVDALEEPPALQTALRAKNAKDWWDGA
ncbi:MAG: hypothetical protein AAF681_13300, partial [Pseudomonadota bacterium]